MYNLDPLTNLDKYRAVVPCLHGIHRRVLAAFRLLITNLEFMKRLNTTIPRGEYFAFLP